MQTWMDSEVNDALKTVEDKTVPKAERRVLKMRLERLGVRGFIADGLRRSYLIAATVNDEFREIGMRLSQFGIVIPGTANAELALLTPLMIPFFDPASTTDGHGNPVNTVALHPTSNLINDLADAKPPKGAAAGVVEQMREAVWYIDLPHGALRLGDYQVRAAFTEPVTVTSAGEMGLHIACILTRLNTDKTVARMHWTVHVHGDDFIISDPKGCARVSDVDWDVVREQVSHLLCLLALYRSTADKAERGHLPLITERDLMRHPQNRAKHPKKFSLFRVETLAPPKDRFGRGERDGAGAGGWKLGWRTPVRGHFKMQPHGPRNSLRKLIWVSEFDRAKDKPVRPTIERLDVPLLDVPKDMPLPPPATPAVLPLGL